MNDNKLKKDCFRFTEKLLYGYVDIDEFIQDTVHR